MGNNHGDELPVPDVDVGLPEPVERALLWLILANVVAVVLETIEPFATHHRQALVLFETFSVGVFSFELLWRVALRARQRALPGERVGPLRYLLSAPGLVDLAAILPFYLPALLPWDLRFVRVLRLARLLRLLKLGRYLESLRMLQAVLRSKRDELVVMCVLAALLLLLSSCVMFHLEHELQPDKFSSIPAAMWWAVSTLTTVGYGDLYPVTAAGKVVGALIAMAGIGLFALPTGLLAGAFAEELRRSRERALPATGAEGTVCPHCGGRIGGD